jgi:RimJ/RimL family protein N-acetyltransferase
MREISKVALREWQESDADWVHSACQDPDIQEWTTVPVPYKQEHAKAFIRIMQGREGGFAITIDGTGAGSIGVTSWDHKTGIAEVGYWIAPWARGHGLASSALAILEEWARRQGLRRLELLIEPSNMASKRVAERSGYTSNNDTVDNPVRGEPRVMQVWVKSII